MTQVAVVPFSSAHLEHTAWQVSVSWILTGEKAHPLVGVVPKKPFDPTIGHWGAWLLVGRYAELNIDSSAFPLFCDPASSARSAKAWAIGLNWCLNRNVQLKTNFSHTVFHGGGSGTSAPGMITHPDENVLFTRVQLGF